MISQRTTGMRNERAPKGGEGASISGRVARPAERVSPRVHFRFGNSIETFGRSLDNGGILHRRIKAIITTTTREGSVSLRPD